MTLEEVIEYLEKMIEIDKIYEVSSGAEENRQLAEWLKELKAYREQSGDVISRQAVLEGLRTCYDTETKEYSDGSQWINYEDAVAEMENLPPVSPQPKMGRWIDADVLDKIRAEIEQHRRKTQSIDPYDLVGDCLEIIDKYRAESEE